MTVGLKSGARVQLFRRNRHDFAVPPDIQRQTFAGVLFDDFLDRRLERQKTALGQRQFQNTLR